MGKSVEKIKEILENSKNNRPFLVKKLMSLGLTFAMAAQLASCCPGDVNLNVSEGQDNLGSDIGANLDREDVYISEGAKDYLSKDEIMNIIQGQGGNQESGTGDQNNVGGDQENIDGDKVNGDKTNGDKVSGDKVTIQGVVVSDGSIFVVGNNNTIIYEGASNGLTTEDLISIIESLNGQPGLSEDAIKDIIEAVIENLMQNQGGQKPGIDTSTNESSSESYPNESSDISNPSESSNESSYTSSNESSYTSSDTSSNTQKPGQHPEIEELYIDQFAKERNKNLKNKNVYVSYLTVELAADGNPAQYDYNVNGENVKAAVLEIWVRDMDTNKESVVRTMVPLEALHIISGGKVLSCDRDYLEELDPQVAKMMEYLANPNEMSR